MKIKKKRVIPLMVLAMTCITSAGMLSACDTTSEHTHTYTEWNHNDSEHWKECPEDHAIDETTREGHEFVAGECECGATEAVVPVQYGTVTGKIRLHKQGSYETDFAGVNFDLSDDGAELTFDTATGVFEFTNVKAGQNHILTITKSGYRDYTVPSVLVEENQTATIGGEDGIVLEYDVFGTLENWDMEYHDFSKVNEADPSITFKAHDGDKTLNVLTKESFTNVSASLRINWNNSTHTWHTQGIVLKFEDGSHAIIRYHNGDMENGNIQYANSMWSSKSETSIFAESDLNEYGEKPVHTLLSSETEAIKNGDGANLTVVVNNGKIYTYFAENWVATYAIPEGTVGKKVQVGYFAYNAANDAVFHYEISEAVVSTQSSVNIAVNKPADADAAAANVTADKETCEIGEPVILSVIKPLGYKLDTLLVNNIDRTNDVVDNALTIIANRSVMSVEATFVKEEPIAINITVKGKKLGTTAVLAENTAVTFKNTNYAFSVTAEGTIASDAVVKGRYIVVVDGYFEKEILLDETLQEIVLEYDAFSDGEHHGSDWNGVYGNPSNIDKTHVNDEDSYFIINDGTNDFYQYTNATYDNVSASVTYVEGIAANPGIRLVFENNKAVMMRIEGAASKAQWIGGNDWDEAPVNANIWDFGEGEAYFKPLSEDLLTKYASEGLELKLVRNGLNVFGYVDGKLAGVQTLPAEYADMKCRVCMNAAQVSGGKEVHFKINENLSTVALTDGTAEDAGGSIGFSENVKIGDTVTVTVSPDPGYMLENLTVSDGTTPESAGDNVYTFVATKDAYTVTATFVGIPATEAEAVVTGVGLDDTALDMNGKDVTFRSESGIETTLTVSGGTVKGILAAGTYTVCCDGFYDLTATVEADGRFATDTNLAFTQIVFEHNILGDGGIGDASKVEYSHAATDGYLTVKEQTDLYAFSTEFYDDVAFSATFRKNANDNNHQGIFMAFGKSVGSGQQAIGVRFENDKAQFLGDWLWGLESIGKKWDFGTDSTEHANPMSEELINKYNSAEGLTLTLARKGSIVYVLIDGEIYAAHLLGDYATNKVCFGIYVPMANPGYNIPFDIETDVDSLLTGAVDAHNVLSTLGKWTVTDTTMAVQGNGYAEFAPWDPETTESLKIRIAAQNSSAAKHAQGLTYRFENGKWLAVRIESTDTESYIQYSEDALLPSGTGHLRGWTLVHNLTDEEKSAFDGDGIDLQLVRSGATIYVLLNGAVIDTIVLDAEYETMDGVMAATIENSTGNAVAYEYKTGEAVVLPGN